MKKNPDCWKRKNKKEKETSSMKSEASDNMETEQKRQKQDCVSFDGYDYGLSPNFAWRM